MNNLDSGTGFLSGYTGGFLGLSRNQQIESSNPSRAQNDPGQSSMNTSTGLPSFRPILPKGVILATEKERNVGASNGVDNTVNNITSDDDDMSDGNGENGCGGKGQKGCNWQRMKWTDNIVRLLIKVVGCVGDDGSLEGSDGLKRKSSHLHKKGKWKTVSKIMISKGCYVSPQQCEDKFNDLNKRYKKLNDILGKGASCKVVENPTLMDSMPHLSEKAKETVKKLLCSKHLFYREMCSYHNGQEIPDSHDLELQVWKNDIASSLAPECSKENNCLPIAAQCSKDNNGSQEIEAKDSDESDDHESESEDDDDDDDTSGDEYKMRNSLKLQSRRQDLFQAEIDKVFKDSTKSQWQRREWIKKRVVQLQEERIGIQSEALELEKQKIKWQRFCSKKEMELETARLEKQKLILDIEHRAMQLKQEEVEMEFQKPEASFQLTTYQHKRITRKTSG